MKNKVILIFIIMLISIGFLSGCNEQKELENKKTYAELIVGTWKTDFGAIKIYYPNGEFYLEFTTNDTSTGKYILEDNRLTEVYDQTGNTWVYLIEFYDEDTFYEKNIETSSIAPLLDILLTREN
jgi:hypothetical protein